mgnify:CR=1 FL=1
MSDFQATSGNGSAIVQGSIGSAALQNCTGCSVYITIGANATETALSSDERELIDLYRRLAPKNKLRLIKAAADIEALEGRERNGEHEVDGD